LGYFMEYLFPFLRGLEFYTLILIRLFAMFAFTPLFSNNVIPVRTRIFLAAAITFVCVSFLEQAIPFQASQNLIQYAFYMINEALVGFCIGFVILIFFTIYQLSAQFFSFQIGFGISSVFDPLSQVQIPLTGQLQTLFGLLIFIAIGGLENSIAAIIESYKAFGIGGFQDVVQSFPHFIAKGFVDAFKIAAQLALPIMVTLFIITASLGLLARFAPQMNLLMIGFPIYILVGLIFLFMYAPIFVEFTGNVLREIFTVMFDMFRSGAGG
jgi:flagellar biosynthesis protein FliR